MSDSTVAPEVMPPLSQPMRVIDTFVAPSKTFMDILRSANCWLPLVLIVVMSVAWGAVIDKKVGWDTVSQVQMAKSPARADQLNQLPPPERAEQMTKIAKVTSYFTYASFIFVVIFLVVEALILWAAFNFGLGAKTTFPQVFAVTAFASLPRTIFTFGISMVLMFAGVGTENFDVQNPVGTNIGYYLVDSAHWLQAAGRFFDVFGIWSLVLLILGMAMISGRKLFSSAMIIVGLWLVGLIITVGFSAAMG